MEDCFRPLLGFFISKYAWHYIMLAAWLFSSPAGVLYFKIEEFCDGNVGFGFRPLLGFFISKSTKGNYTEKKLEFSSPAGVLYFKIVLDFSVKQKVSEFSSPAGVLYFKMRIKCVNAKSRSCFRPLLGFFISKLNLLFVYIKK